MEFEIECPKCEWKPDGGEYWQCKCGTMWDTFKTTGICPNCKKIWKETQCPECIQWSPHIDWYKNLNDALRKELESIREPTAV